MHNSSTYAMFTVHRVKESCVLTYMSFFWTAPPYCPRFISITQTHFEYKCLLLRCWQMPRVNKMNKTENIMFHSKSSSSLIKAT